MFCNHTRRSALACFVLAALGLTATWTQAQTAWPAKPVKIIVPYPPGGAVDQVTRKIAQKLTEQTGQSFFVENKAGATGTIGSSQVAQSTPDGYTLLANDTTYSMLPHVFKKLPWDYERDLVPVVAFNFAPFTLAVAAESKFKSLQELVAFAKSNPTKLTYGTGGPGSSPHFVTEALRSAAGIEVTHIPYKGAGEATLALLSGTIDFQMASTPGVMGQVNAGKMRLLAVSGDRRLKRLPDVPTFKELGLKQYGAINFTGLWVPKGTPPGVAARLQKEVDAAMATADFQIFADNLGAVPFTVNGSLFAKMLRDSMQKWGEVATAAGIEKQ